MSYDIDLIKERCPTCGHEARVYDLPNPTYNLTPIFHMALTGLPMPNEDISEGAVVLFKAETDSPRGLRVLNGVKATDSMQQINRALIAIEENPSLYRKMEPANRWGTLEDAVHVLAKMRQAAKDYPDYVWCIR